MSRQQLERWVNELLIGLRDGLGGPGLRLDIQSHFPAQAPALHPGSIREESTLARAGASLSGVHA